MAFTEKALQAGPPLELGGRHVKRYFVTPDPGDFDPAVEQAAYAALPTLLPEPDGTPPASFAVLHRGRDGAAYLNVYSWVWDNVLHIGAAAAAQPELDCPDLDPTHFIRLDRPWIGCVWELPPLLHERDAWVRHMLTPDRADLDGYLADSYRARTTEERL